MTGFINPTVSSTPHGAATGTTSCRPRALSTQTTVASGQTLTCDLLEHKNFLLRTTHPVVSIVFANPTKPGREGTCVVHNQGKDPVRVDCRNDRVLLGGDTTSVYWDLLAGQYLVLTYLVLEPGLPLLQPRIARLADPVVTGYVAMSVYSVGTAVEPNTPYTTGEVTGFAVAPALPAGLALNAGTGVISGTPTSHTPQATYTVTATHPAGKATVDLVVRVVDAQPVAMYALPEAWGNPITVGTAVNWVPLSTGGENVVYTVAPALPAGLTLNNATGAITGTVTQATELGDTYEVKAQNTGGTAPVVWSIAGAVQCNVLIHVTAP